MTRIAANRVGDVEVSRADPVRDRLDDALRKSERHPIDQGKALFGRAVKAAIGSRVYKEIGDSGQITNVVNGPGVPDYLGRLCATDASRVRMAKVLLNGVKGVRFSTLIHIDEDEAVGE